MADALVLMPRECNEGRWQLCKLIGQDQQDLLDFLFTFSISTCPPSASPSGEAGGDEIEDTKSLREKESGIGDALGLMIGY